MFTIEVDDDGSIRFNRYIVECKYLTATTTQRATRVLIDTQWNVNTVIRSIAPADGSGFNRYIVECK